MAKSFAAQVDAWVLATRERTLAVIKSAAQSVIEDVAQRTPVDTGYLRASLTASLNGPIPMRAAPAGEATFNYDPQQYSLVIAGMQLGAAIHATFVANYAAHVEYGARGRAGVGMVRLAAQNWQQHVNQAASEAKGRVPSS